MEAEIEKRVAGCSEQLRRLMTIPGVEHITASNDSGGSGNRRPNVCRCASFGKLGDAVSGQPREKRKASEGAVKTALC
jgi:hypothetical protein